MKLPVSFRPAVEEDLPLILDSWAKSYLGRTASEPRGQSPLCHIPAPLYFERQRAVSLRLIQRSLVDVAHAEGEPDHIIGWCCWEVAAGLHFVYVTKMWRREGVGSALICRRRIEGMPAEYSHHTRIMGALARRWRLRFNPWSAD